MTDDRKCVVKIDHRLHALPLRSVVEYATTRGMIIKYNDSAIVGIYLTVEERHVKDSG